MNNEEFVENKCHICGEYADYSCENCGEYVCDNCIVPYTLHNPVDWTQCINCGDSATKAASDAYFAEIERNRKINELDTKKKSIRNEKARIRYNSAEQKEKRRLKKIKKLEEQLQFRKEMWDLLTKNLL